MSAEHQTQSGFRWLATLLALSAERSRNHYSCLSFPAEKMSFRNLRGDSGGECSVLGGGGHLAEAVILRRSRLSEGAPSSPDSGLEDFSLNDEHFFSPSHLPAVQRGLSEQMLSR